MAIETVDITRLVVSEVGNDRTYFDPSELERLAKDIASNGQISPVIVRPGLGQQLEIVAGESRTRAIRDVLGSARITVDVRELTDDQAWQVMLSENTLRTDLDPVDEGRAMVRRQSQNEWSLNELSRQWQRSKGYCTDRMALVTLCDDVAFLVRTGQLSIRQGAGMSGLSPERQRAVVRSGHGLSAEGWRRLCSEQLNSQNQQGFDLDWGQQEYNEAAAAYVDELAQEEPPAPEIPPEAAKAFAAALVGPTEIAQRFDVSRSTVAKWVERYPSFPKPLTTIGGGRPSPRAGGKPSAGTPIYFMLEIENWHAARPRVAK